MRKITVSTLFLAILLTQPIAGALELYGLASVTLTTYVSSVYVCTLNSDIDSCLGVPKQELDRRIEDAFFAKATGEVSLELSEFVYKMRGDLPGLVDLNDDEIIQRISEINIQEF